MFVNIFIHCAFICLTCCLEIDFICFRRVYIIYFPSNVIFSTCRSTIVTKPSFRIFRISEIFNAILVTKAFSCCLRKYISYFSTNIVHGFFIYIYHVMSSIFNIRFNIVYLLIIDVCRKLCTFICTPFWTLATFWMLISFWFLILLVFKLQCST